MTKERPPDDQIPREVPTSRHRAVLAAAYRTVAKDEGAPATVRAFARARWRELAPEAASRPTEDADRSMTDDGSVEGGRSFRA